jgi:hypothetical protein
MPDFGASPGEMQRRAAPSNMRLGGSAAFLSLNCDIISSVHSTRNAPLSLGFASRI